MLAKTPTIYRGTVGVRKVPVPDHQLKPGSRKQLLPAMESSITENENKNNRGREKKRRLWQIQRTEAVQEAEGSAGAQVNVMLSS